jgi:lysozyme
MNVSPEAIALIKAFEGKELVGYLCPAKVPTIGYGHTEAAGGVINYVDGVKTTKVRVGARITYDEAARIKAADTETFAKAIAPMVRGIDLNPMEFGSLVSLAFNIGSGAFARSSVLRHLKAGNKAKAADAFLAWNKAGGKVLSGLTRRRQAERALFLGRVAEAERITGAPLSRSNTKPVDVVKADPKNLGKPPAPVSAPPPPDIPKPETPASAPRIGFWGRFVRALRGR